VAFLFWGAAYWQHRYTLGENMKQMLIKSLILTVFLFFQSCEDEVTSPVLGNGSIIVKVRVGLTQQIPRDIVTVDLKRIDENSTTYPIVSSKRTNSDGIVIFDNLEKGRYHLVPQKNELIGEVFTSIIEIDSIDSNDTTKLGILYYWNFNTFNTTIEVDTTVNLLGYSNMTFFFNNGIRDTLTCQFDESNIPEWMSFASSNNVYPPNSSYSNSSSYLLFSYDPDEIPINLLPVTIKIPIIHQFGEIDYSVNFVIKE